MPPTDDFWEATRRQYGFDEWPGREALVPAARSPFLPRAAEFQEFTFDHRSALPDARNAYIDHYRHASDGDAWIAVTIAEYETPQDAHEGLIRILAHSMAARLPRGQEQGLNIGDISFCGFGELIDKLFFVRQNLLVGVESVGPKPVSVVDFAATLDAQIVHRGS
jgi:hypothetical protein